MNIETSKNIYFKESEAIKCLMKHKNVKKYTFNNVYFPARIDKNYLKIFVTLPEIETHLDELKNLICFV